MDSKLSKPATRTRERAASVDTPRGPEVPPLLAAAESISSLPSSSLLEKKKVATSHEAATFSHPASGPTPTSSAPSAPVDSSGDPSLQGHTPTGDPNTAANFQTDPPPTAGPLIFQPTVSHGPLPASLRASFSAPVQTSLVPPTSDGPGSTSVPFNGSVDLSPGRGHAPVVKGPLPFPPEVSGHGHTPLSRPGPQFETSARASFRPPPASTGHENFQDPQVPFPPAKDLPPVHPTRPGPPPQDFNLRSDLSGRPFAPSSAAMADRRTALMPSRRRTPRTVSRSVLKLQS